MQASVHVATHTSRLQTSIVANSGTLARELLGKTQSAAAQGAFCCQREGDSFVRDVLDPTYLERFDKDRHQARLLLINSEARDVKDIVTITFGAQYVIYGYPQAKRLLDDNPDFVRIRPPPGPPLPPGSGPSGSEVRRR